MEIFDKALAVRKNELSKIYKANKSISNPRLIDLLLVVTFALLIMRNQW